MNFIDKDQTVYLVNQILIEEVKKRGQSDPFVQGFNWALTQVELMTTHTDWDERKKLLQPEFSNIDWSQTDAMLEGVMEYVNCNCGRYKPHGGGWLQDWLKNFMKDYDINPATLLMEDNEDGE